MSATAITVSIIGNAAQLRESLASAEKQTESFAKKAGKAAKLAAVGIAGGLAATFKSGLEGLQEGAEAEAKFEDALGRSNSAVRKQAGAMKELGEEFQNKTKFTYEDILAINTVIAKQQVLSQVVRNGVASTETLTRVSADMATVLGVDGAAAAEMLGKALASPEKSAKLLQKAGVKLTAGEAEKLKAWAKSGKVAEAQGFILDKLKKKTEGAAAAAGDTMAGKMDRAKNAFGEVQESLASGLLPAVTKLMDKLLVVAKWAQDNPAKFKTVAIVLGGFAAAVFAVTTAIKIWQAVTKAFTAVQAAFNAVMAMNPAVLITIAIVALGAALVVAYKKSETFREIVNRGFEVVKRAVEVLRDAFVNAWDKMRFGVNAALKMIGGAYLTAADVWLGIMEKLLRGAGHLPKWLGGGKFDSAADAVASIRGGLHKLKKSLDSLPTSKDMEIKAHTDEANRKINELRQNILAVGGVDVTAKLSRIGTNKRGIDLRAAGGPVTAGTPYIVGEKGPELIIPGASGTVIPNHMLRGGSYGGGMGGGGGRITIDVTGADHEMRQFVRKILKTEGLIR